MKPPPTGGAGCQIWIRNRILTSTYLWGYLGVRNTKITRNDNIQTGPVSCDSVSSVVWVVYPPAPVNHRGRHNTGNMTTCLVCQRHFVRKTRRQVVIENIYFSPVWNRCFRFSVEESRRLRTAQPFKRAKGQWNTKPRKHSAGCHQSAGCYEPTQP